MSSFVFSPLRMVGGTAVGVGVGVGVSEAIAPIIRQLANEAWSRYLSLPLQAIEAAQLVASGERDMGWGIGEAHNTGIGDERFRALVDMVDEAPDLATLFDLLHRRLISEGDFREGARKGMIEDKWIGPLVQLAERVLSPAEAAQAWQRGYMSEEAAEREAALSGVSTERARIQRESAGLPPGPETALAMLRRGVIDSAEFEQMIREGNTKTKYTDEYLVLRDQITRPETAAGLWLRGWMDEAEAKAIGALSGYGAEEMEHLYLNRGRPATSRQIHIGYQRGGSLPGAANEREAFERGVRQSNVRTEYTDLLWAQRHTYPSAFVIRALASDGTFDRPTTERILIESGWVPEYAELAAAKWAGDEETGPPTKWVDRARSRLFTTLRTEYLDEAIDAEQARAGLARVGAAPAEVGPIIGIWDFENSIARRELTPSQIKKAYKEGPPDGFTYDDALARLIDAGYTSDDADTLLTT